MALQISEEGLSRIAIWIIKWHYNLTLIILKGTT